MSKYKIIPPSNPGGPKIVKPGYPLEPTGPIIPTPPSNPKKHTVFTYVHNCVIEKKINLVVPLIH